MWQEFKRWNEYLFELFIRDIYDKNQPKNAFILFIEYLKWNYIKLNLRKTVCLHLEIETFFGLNICERHLK